MPTPPMAVPHLAVQLGDRDWRAQARCRRDDAPQFYPPGYQEPKEDKAAREGAARALCARCSVQETCLEYSLVAREPHGIWGGLNELERRRLIRDRQQQARSA